MGESLLVKKRSTWCAFLGHKWRAPRPVPNEKIIKLAEGLLVCDRCGSFRDRGETEREDRQQSRQMALLGVFYLTWFIFVLWVH
jgi:hypothetical protein